MARPFLLAFAALVAVGATACSPKFDWREIRSTADAYAVALPGKPQIVTHDVEVPVTGGTQKVSMTMTSAGVGSTLFAVGAARLSPEIARSDAALQPVLAYFRDGLLRNIGVMAPVKEVPPGALAARGATMRAATSFEARGELARPGEKPSPARLAARIYVVDDRLYQIVALGSDADLPDSEIENFFTSFHLTAP